MSEGGLRRDIGFTGSAFLSFNGIVGAGIFALPATLHLQFGAFSPWLFPLFGLLVLLVALPFARLAALMPQSGGPVAYTAVVRPARLVPGRLALLCGAQHRARRQRQCLRHLRRLALAAARHAGRPRRDDPRCWSAR